MHIERILLRDVGPFADVTLELPVGKDRNLTDVYLLTGPNGTGKHSLYALATVLGEGREELDEDLLERCALGGDEHVLGVKDVKNSMKTCWCLGCAPRIR